MIRNYYLKRAQTSNQRKESAANKEIRAAKRIQFQLTSFLAAAAGRSWLRKPCSEGSLPGRRRISPSLRRGRGLQRTAPYLKVSKKAQTGDGWSTRAQERFLLDFWPLLFVQTSLWTSAKNSRNQSEHGLLHSARHTNILFSSFLKY